MSVEELRRVRYLDCSPWNELSGGTLLIADAAERIRTGIAENERTKNIVQNIRETADFLRIGGHVDEVLLVAQSQTTQRIPIEGHTRLTALLLNSISDPISAILGTSPDLAEWLTIKWS